MLGATPMVFHKVNTKVVLDAKLKRYESIYGGGKRTRLLEPKTNGIIRINNTVVADITG